MASYWSTLKSELKRLVDQTGDYCDVQIRRSRLGISLPCPRRDRLGVIYLAAERKEFELDLKVSLATVRSSGRLNACVVVFQAAGLGVIKRHTCYNKSFDQEDQAGALRYVKARLAYIDRLSRQRRLRQVNKLLDELTA